MYRYHQSTIIHRLTCECIVYNFSNQCTKQAATSRMNSVHSTDESATTHPSSSTSSLTEDSSHNDQEQVSTTDSNNNNNYNNNNSTSSESKERDEHHHHHHLSMYQEKTCHFPGFGGTNGLLSYDW